MSSKTPWTPGPWVETGDSDWHPEQYEGSSSSTSWTVIRSDSADYDVAIVMFKGRHDHPVLDANARLIAAAPEMAEAIRDWVDYLSDESDELGSVDFEEEILARFRALLSRIEGEGA